MCTLVISYREIMNEEIDFNRIYDQIQDLLLKKGGNISVLEEEIDIEMQRDYFNYSKEIMKRSGKRNVLYEKSLLIDAHTTFEKKKEILSTLAKLDEPEAYRAIQAYKDIVEEDLKDWTTLALQESKMVLETSLLGKAPIFISTGLGGKGTNLRYYLVFVGKEEKEFEHWQKDLINKELSYKLKSHGGEVESSEVFIDRYCVTFFLPLSVNVKDVISSVVSECNEFGDFLMHSFIVTNIKKIEGEELQKMIEEYRCKNNEGDDCLED